MIVGSRARFGRLDKSSKNQGDFHALRVFVRNAFSKVRIMSDDDYALTEVKRRRIDSHNESDNDLSDDGVEAPLVRRRLKKKQIDLDDIDLLNENEKRDNEVGVSAKETNV